MTSVSGLNLGNLFNHGMDAVSKRGADIQAKMEALGNQESISPEEMAMINFEMGQYNAMLEAVATLTKSMTDMLKSLAQRAG